MNNSSKKVQPKGEITFLIEYPQGAEESFQFLLIPLKENETPILLEENKDYRKTSEGLLVTTDSFSPFIVGWRDVSLEDSLGKVTEEDSEKSEPIVSEKKAETKEKISPSSLLLTITAILLI